MLKQINCPIGTVANQIYNPIALLQMRKGNKYTQSFTHSSNLKAHSILTEKRPSEKGQLEPCRRSFSGSVHSGIRQSKLPPELRTSFEQISNLHASFKAALLLNSMRFAQSSIVASTIPELTVRHGGIGFRSDYACNHVLSSQTLQKRAIKLTIIDSAGLDKSFVKRDTYFIAQRKGPKQIAITSIVCKQLIKRS